MFFFVKTIEWFSIIVRDPVKCLKCKNPRVFKLFNCTLNYRYNCSNYLFCYIIVGCQFYPVDNHFRFVRLSETTAVGSEVMQIEVHPRRNLSLQPVDNVSTRVYYYTNGNE